MDNQVRYMLEALLLQSGQLQWIDCYSIGSNEGGRFVSLFNSRAKFRMCTVYEESFKKLPKSLLARFPKDGDFGGTSTSDRDREEKSGRLKKCDPFSIVRWRLNPDDDHDKWRFHAVVYEMNSTNADVTVVNNTGAQQPSISSQEMLQAANGNTTTNTPDGNNGGATDGLRFTSIDQAIKWSVGVGGFADEQEAESAYDEVKRSKRPKSAKEMFDYWHENVVGILEKK